MQDADRLTPALTMFMMILYLPYLINFVAEIALYPPTIMMHRIATLCLNIGAASKIVFYITCDKHLANDLSLCSNRSYQTPSRSTQFQS